MHHPHIKFYASPIKDSKTAALFIKEAKYSGGQNLEWAFYAKYPELRSSALKDARTINDLIKKKYANIIGLRQQLAQHEQRWNKISKKYFALVEDLFGARVWPKGKYVAYGTIWGMYPRFLEDKTFQIPYKHKHPRYILVVIAHELLHFMFYDYFFEIYPKYRANKYNFFVWNVSEIFNTVIQNSSSWIRVFKTESMSYPEHEKIVAKILKKFVLGQYADTQALIGAIILEMKTSLKKEKLS